MFCLALESIFYARFFTVRSSIIIWLIAVVYGAVNGVASLYYDYGDVYPGLLNWNENKTEAIMVTIGFIFSAIVLQAVLVMLSRCQLRHAA